MAADKVRKVKKSDVEAGKVAVDPLPPAGAARKEELARRQGTLDEAADEAASNPDAPMAIDPSKLEKDPEAQKHISREGDIPVSNMQPGYTYCWVNHGFNGQFVRRKQTQGWQLVTGNMPEAQENAEARDASGVVGPRRVVDVVLMRITYERYMDLTKRRQQKQRAMELGVTAPLRDIAASASRQGLGVKIHAGEAHPRDLVLNSRTGSARNALESQTAMNKFEGHLRRGDMPGAQIGR